eukprot:TRINITY_DN6612_c1_g1_i1.p1 TRINITY_DN6612_c1_g1~~TRINITY_DN6612_c1_g1_i1.p1  ORF type:complete len:720 (+),score=142.71 TRINITY_DN6612_c1_g1_i1:102-2162(+)
MINVQAVADILNQASLNTGGSGTDGVIASLLNIASALQQQQAQQQHQAESQQPQQQQQQQQEQQQQHPSQLANSMASLGVDMNTVEPTSLQQDAGQMWSLDAHIDAEELEDERKLALESHQDSAISASQSMETFADSVQQFMQRYPVDSRAHDYLVSSSPEVIAYVLREFRPPREGEADYSSLLTTYVKRTRQHQVEQEAAESANTGSANVEFVGQQGPAVGREDDSQVVAEILDSLQEFVTKYPMDDRAYDFFMNAPPHVQLRVLREFRPNRMGQGDYSAIITSFTKKCLEQSNHPHGHSPGHQTHRSAPHRQTPGGAPPDLNTAMATPGFDTFFTRYPIDERAYDFFASSSLEAQAKVLSEFRPPREGEVSYSGLFTAFVKKCRQNPLGSLPPNLEDQPQQHPHGHQYGGKGGCSSWHSCTPVASAPSQESSRPAPMAAPAAFVLGDVTTQEAPDLEAFRAQHPMDDRAFQFLESSPIEVQHRVVETFFPSRRAFHENGLENRDFSAPVTAYVRSLREKFQQDMPNGGLSDEAVARFFERYPCDDRAVDYFASCLAEVQAQVLRDFRPRQEGDPDYSAPVTAFIKRCRSEGGHFGYGGCKGYAGKTYGGAKGYGAKGYDGKGYDGKRHDGKGFDGKGYDGKGYENTANDTSEHQITTGAGLPPLKQPPAGGWGPPAKRPRTWQS